MALQKFEEKQQYYNPIFYEMQPSPLQIDLYNLGVSPFVPFVGCLRREG